MSRTKVVALTGLIAVIVAAVVAAALLLSNDSDGEPTVTLVGVPQAEIDAQHLTLAEADLAEARIDRHGIRVLADRIVACAEVRQTELVTLTNGDTGDTFVAWAINYDTHKAGRDPPFGGRFRTWCTNNADFFVAFLDARTGQLAYVLARGYGYQYAAETAVPEGITREQLSAAGIGLKVPVRGSSVVEPPTYEYLYSLSMISGTSIREVLLATLTSEVDGVARGRLVWVVSTPAMCTPDYGSDAPSCLPKPAVVLLDGYTHEFLHATEVG